MIPTPRTDAAVKAAAGIPGWIASFEAAVAVARELERELKEARDLHGNAVVLLNEETLKGGKKEFVAREIEYLQRLEDNTTERSIRNAIERLHDAARIFRDEPENALGLIEVARGELVIANLRIAPMADRSKQCS